jgi:arginine deiminase
MPIRVESETGALRRVLVHRPGPEIDRMIPEMMAELLFDDILFGKQARREHRGFCEVLRLAGAETLDPQDLLAEVLEEPTLREEILAKVQSGYRIVPAPLARLADLEPGQLAEALVGGVRAESGAGATKSALFHLAPIPNYFFQRDPQAVIGNRVIVSSMATTAREREPKIARILFDHHPALQGHAGLLPIGDGAAGGGEHDPEFAHPTLEGGDVLVASEDTLLVGISERTNRRGMEVLAEQLRTHSTPFRNLLFVELPSRRSYMHLDTVFTFIDERTCLGFLPVVEAGHPESAHVCHVDLTAQHLTFTMCGSLLEALAEIDLEVEVVPCGGSADIIDQEREQWTDGANAFALAPGVILLYRRNRHTLKELQARGWRIVKEVEVLDGREELLGQGRTVVTFLGNELSRARGGPRCMTMPLERAPA